MFSSRLHLRIVLRNVHCANGSHVVREDLLGYIYSDNMTDEALIERILNILTSNHLPIDTQLVGLSIDGRDVIVKVRPSLP